MMTLILQKYTVHREEERCAQQNNWLLSFKNYKKSAKALMRERFSILLDKHCFFCSSQGKYSFASSFIQFSI